nr:MAG TPA: hypothetical protein [Caudoviricetes sp.]
MHDTLPIVAKSRILEKYRFRHFSIIEKSRIQNRIHCPHN